MSRGHCHFKLLRWAEWGAVLLSTVVAAVVVFGYYQHRGEVAEQLLEQNWLKLAATRENVEGYIDRIRTDLRMIALDDEVVTMTRDSHGYIKAIYEEHYDNHRISEIYVIERGFDGSTRPLMTFEHAEEHDADELDLLEDEADEYRIQIDHMRRFAEAPSLKVLISKPVPLCVDKQGVVVSVPVRSKGELFGIVAGMIPSENISAALVRGNYENMVVLANDRGDVFGCDDLPDETRRWFEDRFEARGVTAFFATHRDPFDVEGYVSLTTQVSIPGDHKWYMAFMFDNEAYMRAGGPAGVMAGWGSGAIVLLLGGAVLLLCRSLRRRFQAEGEARQFNAMLVDALETEKRLSSQLELAREQADAANTTKSEFLANMSHEIRTPMTAVLGFVDLVRDGCQRECAYGKTQLQPHVATIRRNGEHLLGIINDILDLSKIEAGKMTIEHVACHPCQIIADVTSLMRVRADAKKLRFKIEYTGSVPQTIQSDPTRLRQILINLISNAIKFTEQGSVRLVIELVEQDGEPRLQFDVVDTGVGLTEAQVGKLFQAFGQADASTTRKFGGTGLGLIISKRFAELLGGDVTVPATEVGVGTTFRITVATGSLDGVTMLDDAMSATVLAKDDNADVQDIRTDLDGLRILLVEDGPDNQRLISFVLKKAGAEVVVAENGKIAFDMVVAAMNGRRQGDPKHAFDVVLMDMQMPVMDGYEATGQLRRVGYTAPILALTAHAMAGDRRKCLDAGCDDYATKPIDRATLVQQISKLAHRTQAASVPS